ncbi:MAG: NnrS family protein, partial [Gammaproteobacteria bacterium]|nr:NnrS family protein [Gammaproteobacteria bacterium]
QLWRLARWQGYRTFADPLVLVLHVCYSWLGVGLILMGVSQTWGGLSVSAGLHALGVGAMAGLIIAVSSRAAMGHTNRELASDWMLSSVFILINLSALARAIASELPQVVYLAGFLWIAAFVVYGIRIAPMLLKPALKSGL